MAQAMIGAQTAIARGGTLRALPLPPSPIERVAPAAWSRYAHEMCIQPLGAVTASGALGLFALSKRRLGDLGVMRSLRVVRLGSRQVWEGEFVPPRTQEGFLADAATQYDIFGRSNADYAAELRSGAIAWPSWASLSGALAILHRAGKGALRGARDQLFPETRALFLRTDGIF